MRVACRAMAERSWPLPPSGLAARVGSVDGADPLDFYLREGGRSAGPHRQAAPGRLDLRGQAGPRLRLRLRVALLRHFLDERGAHEGALGAATSTDPASTGSARSLSPPLHAFQNNPAPPLSSFDDGYLDLVVATSVFTHIAFWSNWSGRAAPRPGSRRAPHRQLSSARAMSGGAPGGAVLERGPGWDHRAWVTGGDPTRTSCTRSGGCASTGGGPSTSCRWPRAVHAPQTGRATTTHSYIALRKSVSEITTAELRALRSRRAA